MDNLKKPGEPRNPYSKRTYRGKWTDSDLSAVTIAKLLGCHTITARKMLYKLRDANEIIDEDLIGEMIKEYRNQKELNRLRKYV